MISSFHSFSVFFVEKSIWLHLAWARRRVVQVLVWVFFFFGGSFCQGCPIIGSVIFTPHSLALLFCKVSFYWDGTFQGEYIYVIYLFLEQNTVFILFYINFMCRGKRPITAANGSGNVASKKGRGAGGLPNQLVNRALEGLSHGGRSGTRGRGRGWGGRGRGRGFR